jgi:superfamily II DNA or RNA helicase
MATGAGKTLTALALARRIAEKNSPLVVLVVCPFINLCRQWIREMGLFGLHPVACFEGRDRWQGEMEAGYQRLSTGVRRVHAIVATNATYMSDAFQSALRPRVAAGAAHHLLIADEVHNLGAERIRDILLDGVSMRLGLSATPERHYDPVGTSVVLNYFGGIVYQYPLARAVADGRLCRYRYHPVLVELAAEEVDAYEEISAKLSKVIAGRADDDELNDAAMGLLIKRARLVGAASNKLNALDRVISGLQDRPTKAIFYCGDGSTSSAVSAEETRQIQAVSRLLGEKHGLRVREFTYRETPEERDEILRDLATGVLDGIVAIRCLDEGIDLPELRMGFHRSNSPDAGTQALAYHRRRSSTPKRARQIALRAEGEYQ